ncbi:R3H-associated N-terminal domain-containing protein [Hyaloscypha sp. PMI_1271]|nr:R3H-associated N-terminal domain-containing protein [Hyaloscypha sp. PMI_1271]
MAIYSNVPPPSQQPAQATVEIEAWTVSALQSLNISPSMRGTGATLSIPLDSDDARKAASYKPRKEPLKRDSQKRREALLKGKEGSRRRQRWENDRLLHVPNAQPPLPSDWEIHPTYPVHTVPYYLAPLWDAGVRHRAEEIAEEKKRLTSKRSGVEEQKGRVPQELRQKLKKSKGAKSLLQELEEEVRAFVKEFERREREKDGREEELGMDSEDEEIVFVGRNGVMSDEQRKTVEEELEREKMIFDALEGDKGASFGRWLVHSIAAYYGLSSRSVTVGNPRRREAYVGIREMKAGRRLSDVSGELPRPLWGMI